MTITMMTTAPNGTPGRPYSDAEWAAIDAHHEEWRRDRHGNYQPAESVCTGCEEVVDGDLVPWSGQRLCWGCMDFQLDLLAKAVSDDVMVAACAEELAEVLAIDLAFLAGHLTSAEHQDMLRLAVSLPREARTA